MMSPNYLLQWLGDSLVVQKATLQIGVLRHSKVYGDSLTEIALPGDLRVVVSGMRSWGMLMLWVLWQ